MIAVIFEKGGWVYCLPGPFFSDVLHSASPHCSALRILRVFPDSFSPFNFLIPRRLFV